MKIFPEVFPRLVYVIIPAIILASCAGAPGIKEENSFRDYAGYALYCLQQNMTEDALVLLREAERKYPKKAELCNNIAVCFEKKGEMALAEDYYKKAQSLEPSNRYIRKNYERFKALDKK